MEQNNYNHKSDREVLGWRPEMALGNHKDREEREQRLLQEMLNVNLEGSEDKRSGGGRMSSEKKPV
jgi:hypothetical protein